MIMKNWLVLLSLCLFMVSACHSPVYDQTVANVADVKLRTKAAFQKSNNDAKVCPPLVVKPGLYVDTTPINLEKEPSWLKNHIVVRGDELPFSYYSRTIALGAGSAVLTKFQNGLDPAVAVSLSYSGTVKGALDLLSAKSGYIYTVHGKNIMWQAFITKTFDIAFMPGSSDYLMGNSSGTSGTTTASGAATGSVANYVNTDYSSAEYSSLKGTLSVWDDLEKTLNQLKSADGTIGVSEATTTVTVRDRPSNVALMSQYIANLNRKMSKQVLVKVQILNVQLENDFEFGINWQIIANALANSTFRLAANYGTPVAIVPFTTQPGAASGATVLPQIGVQGNVDANGVPIVPSYTILFNALSQQGKVSIVSEPRAVCLNNQVSVIRVVQSQGYIASVQNTALAGTTSTTNPNQNQIGTVTSQITPGTVITGLTVYVLPKIMGKRVYLQVNADFSNNLGIENLGGTGANATIVQAPTVNTQHFSQRSMIHSGDTMILAGLRDLRNTAKANQFLKYQSLGGKGSQMTSSETVILITPYILPGPV